MGRGTNVFQSGEFSFSGLHSTKLATDGKVWHISGILPISRSPQALPNLRFIHSILNKSTFKVASREPQRSLEGASKEPQNLLSTIFQQGFLSSSETIFLSNFARSSETIFLSTVFWDGKSDEKCDESWGRSERVVSRM